MIQMVQNLLKCNKVKVGLSRSKKKCFICLKENILKFKKNVFYFILKAFFILKILSYNTTYFLMSHKVRQAGRQRNLVSYKNIAIEITFLKYHTENEADSLVPDLFLFFE